MSRKTRSKQKNAATQTRDMDMVLQIAHLQEQVKLLTLENDHLRKYIVEEPPAILKATPSIIVSHSNDIAQSAKKRSLSMRGCNCKKNCTSKLCGCAKKNMPCGKLCKCNNCQNQVKDNSEQDEEHLENKEMPQIQNKQITNKNFENVVHKSLFSPDIKIHSSTPNINECQFPSLYFGRPKRLESKYDEEDEIQEEGKEKSEYPKRRSRVANNSLKIDNTYTRKLRSASNEEKRSQNRKNTEEQGLRKSYSNEIGTLTDDILNGIDKRTSNFDHQNIEYNKVTLRCNKKKENLSWDEQSPISNNASSDSKGMEDASMENNKKKVPQHLSNEMSKSFTQEGIEKNGFLESFSDSFDPTKPRNEIPRTPVSGSNSRRKEEELKFPIEFYQAEIDWEKYQTQLVECHYCKRKFDQTRIEKHQVCCKLRRR